MGKERQKQEGSNRTDRGIESSENGIKKDNEKVNNNPGADQLNGLQDDSSKDNDDNKEQAQADTEEVRKELESLKADLEAKTKQCADYLDKLQRTAAEFDNYKKRTAKEKEAIYTDALVDVIGAFLPVLDNVERALKAMPSDGSAQSLKDGVEMVFKQFKVVFKNLGVEEIKAEGEEFDPLRHNAVMHVEDEAVGHNVIVEEFQKGYIYKDKVIRYSMVKVAN